MQNWELWFFQFWLLGENDATCYSEQKQSSKRGTLWWTYISVLRERVGNTRNYGQMTERILRQKTKCSSKEMRKARCFQGSFHRGSEKITSKHETTDYTRRHDLSCYRFLDVAVRPLKDELCCLYAELHTNSRKWKNTIWSNAWAEDWDCLD